jgi:hypothetical protein
MKNLLYLIAGITASMAFLIARNRANVSQPVPVEELAHRLEDAWADHHTVA